MGMLINPSTSQRTSSLRISRCSSHGSSATYGMPMVVELGIALDVLVGILILGVFMFQIREQFDSLDIRHLEKLKES